MDWKFFQIINNERGKAVRRSLRAKAAILMAVTMAATNITSMAATNVGTPQSAEKTQKEEEKTDSTQSNADRDPVTSVDKTVETILNGAENRAGETSGTWEGFTWSLDGDVLTVEGKGAMPDKGSRNDYPWQEFSGIVDRIVIGGGITHIGKYAFAEFTFLTGVELSDSVDSIGREAFVSCGNLSDINVRDDIGYIHGRAFGNCDNLPAETLVAKGKGLSGDEHWTMTQGGILTVGGTGKTSNNWDGISRDRVREVVIKDGITTIGQSSFSLMSNLVKVSIPASVTTIEKWAFQFCKSLTDIPVPDTVTTIGIEAFKDCDSLVNVPNEKGACGEKLWWELNREGTLTVRGSGDMSGAIPWKSTPTSQDENIKKVIMEEGVTSIANNAFHSCTNLTEVSIPSTMKKIGQSAFRGCTALTSVTLPDGPLIIENYAFQDCTSLKSINVSEETSLGMDVFKGCTSLSGVDISPSGQYGENLRWKLAEDGTLTFTGTGALKPKKGEATPVWKGSGRDKVKKVVIGEGVTLVGGYEFNGCKNLTEVILPEQSLTSIEDYAFLGCVSLEKINISANVTSIGANAFKNCTNLPDTAVIGRGNKEKVNWELFKNGRLTVKGQGKIPDYGLDYSMKETIKEVVIEEGITGIGEGAFCDYKYLASVKLPATLTSIERSAFKNCPSLAGVEIPAKVTAIEEEAFSGCASLTSVKLSEGLQVIRHQAFEGTKVSGVTIPRTVTILEQAAFPDSTDMTFARLADLEASPLKSTGSSSPQGTNNQHKQNYIYYWNDVMNSYLYRGDDGSFYRVERGSGKLVIEQFTSDKTFVKSWNVTMELPEFGGFFAGENELFMVFGKDNLNDDSKQEVFRVVKYSKAMERLDSVSFYGMNTYKPFDAGSLRMDETDTELYIRTAHEMFLSSDGKHHQANVTLVVNKESMIQSYANVGVSNVSSTGYVSHSFNQFLKVDGDRVVTADHGDAYPRSVVLCVYKTGDLFEEPQNTAVLEIPGETGENYTGVTVGGLEFSDSSYLVAGSSINLDDFKGSKTKNIYLSVVDKNSQSVRNIQVTNYSEGSSNNVSTPHLVKISEDEFVLMWEENSGNTVKLAFFDGRGNRLAGSGAGSVSASLSDCQPIVEDGKVMWYVTNGSNLTFYSFEAQIPASASDVKVAQNVVKTKGGSSSGGSSGGSSSGGSSGGGGGGGGGSSSGSSKGKGENTNGPMMPGTGTSPSSAPVVTGAWKKDGTGWWLEQTGGAYPKSQWAKINGAIYLFNASGYMAEGWQAEGGRWYYLIPGSGAMATGWVKPADNKWYYLNTDGAMATGWVKPADNKWYYLNSSGDMATGWVQVDNKWYYLDGSGAMLANTTTPDGHVVGADGARIR